MVDSITGYLSPPTDEEELRALAERLRGRSLGGQMNSLSGDPVLRGAGEAAVARADNEAKQAGVLIRALKEREQEQGQYDQDAIWREHEMNTLEAGRLKRAEIGARGAVDAAGAGVRRDLDLSKTPVLKIPRGGGEPVPAFFSGQLGQYVRPAEDGSANMILMKDEEWQDALSEKDVEAGRLKANEAVSSATELFGILGEFDENFSQYESRFDEAGNQLGTPWEEIEGMGWLESKPNWVGEALTVLPSIVGGKEGSLETQEAQLNQALIQKFINLNTREFAGLTQTKGEMERVMKDYGQKLLQDPIVMREAVRKLKTAFRGDLANMDNLHPQVKARYLETLAEGESPLWEREVRDLNFPQGTGGGAAGAIGEVAGSAQTEVNRGGLAAAREARRIAERRLPAYTQEELEGKTTEELEAIAAQGRQ